MGTNIEINYNGLDEDLKKVLQEYPDETLTFMRKEANAWKKDCNDKGYSQYDHASANGALRKTVTTIKGDAVKTKYYYKKGKKGKSISNSWKNSTEVNQLHQVTEIQVKNSHPLFHLLENGHAKWLWGKNSGGFVKGKHWAEKTRAEWKDKFNEHVNEYVNKMLGRHNL